MSSRGAGTIRRTMAWQAGGEASHGVMHLAGMGVMLLAAAAVCWAGWLPLSAARAEAGALADALASQRQVLDTTRGLLGRGREQLAQLTEQLEQAPLQLDDVSHLNQRLAALTELARDGELLIHQMQPGEAVAGTDYEIVTIRLAGEATYQTFTRFIDQLHGRMPDIEVRGLEIRGGGATSTGAASFRLECVWYARLRSPIGGGLAAGQ